ncbi:MAG: hypothetical protein NVSMB1_19550 [Polyangiales bacterium]
MSFGLAPYQCKSDDPARAREETPGESLWSLCTRFASKGDDEAARATLDYLMERYPSSRQAARAKDERSAVHPCLVGPNSRASAGSSSVSASSPGNGTKPSPVDSTAASIDSKP